MAIQAHKGERSQDKTIFLNNISIKRKLKTQKDRYQ